MWYWIVGICAALALIFLGIAKWAYKKAFYLPDHKKKVDSHEFFGEERDEFCRAPLCALVDELEALPYEPVTIRSRDGLTLAGRYYRFSDKNRVEIFFHGWRGSALREGCGAAKFAQSLDYNLLLVDQRAHNNSDGNVITYGILEKYDCLDWVNYVVERFGEDVSILLGGVSMGATTVLMASALPLPENVKAITADCPYTTPAAIIRKVARDLKINDRLASPFLYAGARIFGRFSLRSGGALDAVRHATVPIVLVHGEGDAFVPFSMGREIFDACASEKVFLPIPEAGHGLSYFYDTETYTQSVSEFITRYFAIPDVKSDDP